MRVSCLVMKNYLQGSAGIYVLEGGQGLGGEHWGCMQLAASQANVAGVLCLSACLQAASTLRHGVWLSSALSTVVGLKDCFRANASQEGLYQDNTVLCRISEGSGVRQRDHCPERRVQGFILSAKILP